MEPQPYEIARTDDDVRAWLAAANGVRMVAVDTETAGWDPHCDRLLLVQVAAGPGRRVLVVDAQQVSPQALAPLLEAEEVLKVFHHGAFDLRFLDRAGMRVRRVADTMLAQQLLDGGEATDAGVGLAGLAEFRLGMRLDKGVRDSFSAVRDTADLTAAQLQYAADDAAATWGVFDQQWRELVAHGLERVARLEFAVLPVLADLQLRGVAFDAPRWRALVDGLEADLPGLEERAQAGFVTDDSPRDLFGPVPVKLDSPEQVRAALARVGVDVPDTREVVLRDHAGHPAVAALLAYRQVRKVTTNWGGDWATRVVHPHTQRVHGDWRQIVGAGRIACSDPNLTQIPKDARYRCCFGGRPGRSLVVADYSQQELRILAAVSGDRALTEVFLRGGDLHAATAAMVFDVPEDRVTPAQRVAAKSLNFGLMYGMGAPGFARATGTTLAAAQDTMRRYFSTFPQVEAWLRHAEATGRRSGRARTGLGRIRSLRTESAGGMSVATLARNAPIQGAGADMTKLALVETERRLRERFGGDENGLVLVVHDELVAEVAEPDAEEARLLVAEGMLTAAEQVLGEVPAVVDAVTRARWAPVPD